MAGAEAISPLGDKLDAGADIFGGGNTRKLRHVTQQVEPSLVIRMSKNLVQKLAEVR